MPTTSMPLDAPASVEARHHRLTVGPALAWAVVGAVLVAVVAAVGVSAAHSEREAQVDAIRRSIDVYALGLRGTAARFSYLPATVSRHPDLLAVLLRPTDDASVARANRFLEDVNRRAGSSALYVMQGDGLTLAASNWNQTDGFVGHTYANRPYFIDALKGQSGLFYGVGQTTGVPGLFISAPVRHEGAILGVVAVKVSLADLEVTWSKAERPIALTDQRGIVFLTSVPAWRYRATVPLSDADRSWLCVHQPYGDCRQVDSMPWRADRTPGEPGYEVQAVVDGRTERLLALDESLPAFGWTLTVMADPAPVVSAGRSAAAVAALAAAVLLLGGLYWRLRERRYAEMRDASAELERRVQARTRELQEAHAFRKAMEDSLVVGMRARDLTGRIVYVNPALCEMVGYRAEELIGTMPPYRFWHPQEMETHWREHDAAMRGQAPLTGSEHVFRHRDGHDVHCMVYTAALIDAAGQHTGWMSSVVDLTEQKRAEERQRQHDRELQHAGRLASLGEMASTLAHELNQPLMALSGFAAAARAFAEQERRELLVGSLDDIKAQAQRAAEIVKRVRNFVRLRTEGTADVPINDVVANVLALSKAERRRLQARIETHLDPAAGCVAGDRVLLEQMLLNLVLNALQAMQTTPGPRRVVEITTDRNADRLRLSVSDRGPGVPEEDVEHLFESFFTTREDGTGLGLRICRTIVESHRGTIAFSPRDGGGAVFTVEFPVA